jgi:hypothetical protein
MNGQTQKKLINGNFPPGNYYLVWDGRDKSNELLTSGIYLIALKQNQKNISQKLLILK